ncbi:MAG: histidine kinase [Proteobacteria bacterium]|nr:histidine kinase [Pseudomonadota bacterium]
MSATNSSESNNRPGTKRFGLRRRIIVCLAGLALTAVAGGLTTGWYTYEARTLLERILDQDMKGLSIAEQLSSELSMQKGYTTYYALSRDESHLRDLANRSDAFERLLDRAHMHPFTPVNRQAINAIDAAYRQYSIDRLQVIALYSQGHTDEGGMLHWKVRERFNKLSSMVKSLKVEQEDHIRSVVDNAKTKASTMMFMAWTAMAIAVLMSTVLGYVLIYKVLDPLRRMAQGGPATSGSSSNEIEAIGQRMHGLMNDMDRAREHAMQADKLALAGKLAAGVAHSVRNPLTSVKMRLFSLGRSLRLDPTQAEDFEVITEEIGHIDTVLQNFLEFARPPLLRKEHTTLSEVTENAVRLLKHRLDSYGVELETALSQGAKPLNADPERLKEVLVNLLLNACEAMPGGGRIRISAHNKTDISGRQLAMLHIRDWGPGIAANLLERIMEPFFSTKEDGSGLGLAITNRIVMEHGGTFTASRPDDGGMLFEIALPLKES